MLPQPAIRSDAIRPGTSIAPPASPPCRSTAPVSANPLAQTMQMMGAAMSFPRNTEIFGENEPADYVYKVVSGSVRTYKILSDGRRQVGGFYLPGDIFGLEFADEHALLGRSDHRRQGDGGQAQRARPRSPTATPRSAVSCSP